MRYVLDSQHQDFFAKHGYIAFDDLFTADELDAAEKAIAENVRDLWRTKEAVKAISMQKKSGSIAAELANAPAIRIAFDQSLCTDLPSNFPDSPFSLEEVSSVQPILCAMLLRLTEGPSVEKKLPFCPCPKKRGEALIVSGKTLIVLSPLLSLPKQKFLLIAYSGPKPQYVPKEKDPFVHALKSMGYAFGDHLESRTHPVIFSQR